MDMSSVEGNTASNKRRHAGSDMPPMRCRRCTHGKERPTHGNASTRPQAGHASARGDTTWCACHALLDGSTGRRVWVQHLCRGDFGALQADMGVWHLHVTVSSVGTGMSPLARSRRGGPCVDCSFCLDSKMDSHGCACCTVYSLLHSCLSSVCCSF